MQSIDAFLFIEGAVHIFLFFHRVFHRAVEMRGCLLPAFQGV